jgi:uncharacterized protein
VLNPAESKVVAVDKTHFQRWFGSDAPPPVQESTAAKAQRGDAEAQFCLGLSYANGEGAARDYALAEHWYLKAAGQNHALAHFNLGMMHANGQGVPCDRVKSLEWIQLAADLGDAGAQYKLGTTRHRASLDPRSEDASQLRIDAYKWFRLAADQGYLGSETACQVVSLNMTREDVQESGRRVEAFSVRKPNPDSGAQGSEV